MTDSEIKVDEITIVSPKGIQVVEQGIFYQIYFFKQFRCCDEVDFIVNFQILVCDFHS